MSISSVWRGAAVRRVLAFAFAASLLSGVSARAAERSGLLTFGVTDGREVITRDLGRGLLLRVVKERSVSREHFGWRVEVVPRPYRRSSRNLLYESRHTHGAHPSQVYAWHVTSRHFPNDRELDVRGHAITVRVELINPVAEGDGPDARFVSGEIRVSWRPRRGARRAAG
jgi:hypothetical protein